MKIFPILVTGLAAAKTPCEACSIVRRIWPAAQNLHEGFWWAWIAQVDQNWSEQCEKVKWVILQRVIEVRVRGKKFSISLNSCVSFQVCLPSWQEWPAPFQLYPMTACVSCLALEGSSRRVEKKAAERGTIKKSRARRKTQRSFLQ